MQPYMTEMYFHIHTMKRIRRNFFYLFSDDKTNFLRCYQTTIYPLCLYNPSTRGLFTRKYQISWHVTT